MGDLLWPTFQNSQCYTRLIMYRPPWYVHSSIFSGRIFMGTTVTLFQWWLHTRFTWATTDTRSSELYLQVRILKGCKQARLFVIIFVTKFLILSRHVKLVSHDYSIDSGVTAGKKLKVDVSEKCCIISSFLSLRIPYQHKYMTRVRTAKGSLY